MVGFGASVGLAGRARESLACMTKLKSPKTPPTDRKIVFTRHADSRIMEFGLTRNKVIAMLYDCQQEVGVPKGKYPRDSGIESYRSGTYIITLVRTNDKRSYEPISLVLSIFDQRMYLD